MEESLKKGLTRKGLDILCKKGELRDLKIIRKNMGSGFTKSSRIELDYMYQYGEWTDMPFILKTEKDCITGPILNISRFEDVWYHSVAKTTYKIGIGRLNELLKIEMPSHILFELITISSAVKFSELSEKELFPLLNRKENSVRNAASLKVSSLLKNINLSQFSGIT